MTALQSLENYGQNFQLKALSSLLTYKKFLTNVHDIIDPEDFPNPSMQWIVKNILAYYKKYHTIPELDTLKIELKKVDNDVLQIAIKEKLKEAYVASDDDLQYVQEEFTNFCRNQQLKKALLSSVDLLNIGDFDGIRSLVDNALKSGTDKNVGHEYASDIESRYREDARGTIIPTPWTVFNDLLQGGLGAGDFGLFFGNPGGGKSWTLIALGGYAVKLGYNVLYYTLELGEDYVGRRYDAYFTNIEAKDISGHKEKVEDIIPQLPGKLIIKSFPPKRANINTLEAHLQKCRDVGFEPELIIIDYADLLRSTNKKSENKAEVDDVYMDIKGWAKEIEKPIWSVSQVNRDGAKEDVIEGIHAASSYDKLMITDFCASLSRKKEDKTAGTGRFHIMKNRYGDDGMTYQAKVNTGTGHFEIDGIIEEEDDEKLTPIQQNGKKSSTNISKSDRNKLRDKFFELE